MEDRVPLYVALVASLTAIGVAFFNTRGEFAELKQLRSMNEALTGMGASVEKDVLTRARDKLAVRIAARITAAPARRRVVWIVLGVVIAVACLTALVVLLAPSVPRWAQDLIPIVGSLLALVSAASAYWASRSVTKSEVDRAEKNTDALLRAYVQQTRETP